MSMIDDDFGEILGAPDPESHLYSIVYLDPAWQHDADQAISRAATAQMIYPTMTLDQMKRLPVKEITRQNSLMFMWVVSPMLKEGIELGESLGFEYRTIVFVWEKVRVNAGFYTLSSTEICLLFKRGNIPHPRGSRKERQFIQEIRSDHSKKPEEARLRIDRMFPEQKKIELFCRDEIPHWTTWGNQSVCKDEFVSSTFESHGFLSGLK